MPWFRRAHAREVDWPALARRLDDAGFWRDLPDETRSANVAAVSGGASPWSTEIAETVMIMTDGEDLAEGGVERFLGELAPTLTDRGVTLDIERVGSGDGEPYAVTINGEHVELYRPADWDRLPRGLPWYQSTVRPLAALNRLLQAASAAERFFTLGTGGNDGWALLVDPAVVDALDEAGLGSDIERI